MDSELIPFLANGVPRGYKFIVRNASMLLGAANEFPEMTIEGFLVPADYDGWSLFTLYPQEN